MQAFANNITHKETLLLKKDDIKTQLYQDTDALMRTDKDKNSDLFDGRYNNRKDVKYRIDYYDDFLKQFI